MNPVNTYLFNAARSFSVVKNISYYGSFNAFKKLFVYFESTPLH